MSFLKALQYLGYIARHKAYFVYAGITQVGSIPLKALLLHDLSKFSPTEFPTYRQKFYGSENEEQPPQAAWDLAWLHHLHHNAHHPEFWMIEGRPVPMPEECVREMVADWWAVSIEKGGDFQNWLKFAVKKPYHEDTKEILARVLRELGFVVDFPET
jgi:hypothetical protein